jgi:ferritin-like protein
MIQDVYYLLAYLENDLAEFYNKLRRYPRFKAYNDIFEFMEKHSRSHAERVKNMKDDFTMKDFDKNAIIKLQKYWKDVLIKEVCKVKDDDAMLDILAEAEEMAGITYQKIAGEFKRRADRYNKMAEKILKLEQEEYMHRDMLLKSKTEK